jgi:3'-5' exoribonuclease
MDKKYIADFKDKEKIDSFFLLRKKNLKLTKYDKQYMELGLSDKTGKIEGRVWDNAEEFNGVADTGDVVRVEGIVEKFREDKQLKIHMMSKADERAFRYEDMVRVVENRDQIYASVLEYLSTIKNRWIRVLADSFTQDEELMAAFLEGVGGKSWHNAYVGGLLEHTYEVMCIADRVCELYPEADRDIALFGGFMHDIGKVCELDPKKMEYTVEGGLVGHIAIGYKILIKKIESIDGFPSDLRIRVEHIVLSHHGKYEQQSPVLPKTLEATIIYHADELVSQANAIKEIQVAQAEEGKDWSHYVTIKNRKYYIKRPEDEDRGDVPSAVPVTEPEEEKGSDGDLFSG